MGAHSGNRLPARVLVSPSLWPSCSAPPRFRSAMRKAGPWRWQPRLVFSRNHMGFCWSLLPSVGQMFVDCIDGCQSRAMCSGRISE